MVRPQAIFKYGTELSEYYIETEAIKLVVGV